MNKYLLVLLFAIGGLAVLIWGSGIRVITIQPIGALPDGVSAIVYGLNNEKINFIDSPDAICFRAQGGVSLLCRGIVAGKIANEGKILLRFPFSKTLFQFSGAPQLEH